MARLILTVDVVDRPVPARRVCLHDRAGATRFDVVEYLGTYEDQVAYARAALEENDPAAFRTAIGDIARACGMTVGRTECAPAPKPSDNAWIEEWARSRWPLPEPRSISHWGMFYG